MTELLFLAIPPGTPCWAVARSRCNKYSGGIPERSHDRVRNVLRLRTARQFVDFANIYDGRQCTPNETLCVYSPLLQLVVIIFAVVEHDRVASFFLHAVRFHCCRCCSWLEGASSGQRVLDYGSGSGILGLAALSFGAKEV